MANEFKVKKGLIVHGSGSTVLDIQGSQGQLFSITDDLTGTLFAISDISGVHIFDVNADGTSTLDGNIVQTSGNATLAGLVNVPGTSTNYYIGGSGGTTAATNELRIGSTTTTNNVALELYHSLNPVSLGIGYNGGAAEAFIESVHGSYDVNTHMLFKPGGVETWRIGSHGSNSSNKFEIRPAAAGNDLVLSDHSI